MNNTFDIIEELYKPQSEMALKRAGIAGKISGALDYMEIILTPEQKEHHLYKKLVQAVSELEDTYYYPNE